MRPRRSSTGPIGRWAALFASLLVVAAGTAVVPPGAHAAPPYTLEERAAAMVSPSLVYLETVYTGYLRDKATNTPLFASPFVYNRRCSGFVVNPAGHVASTSVCVKPPENTVLQQVLYIAGRIQVAEGKLAADKLDGYVNGLMSTAVFAGLAQGTGPDVQLFAQFNVAAATTTIKPAVPGTVIRVSEPDVGNVAIVKLDQGNLAAAELLPDGELAKGASVTTLGFNTTDSDPRVGTYTPLVKEVQIVGDGNRGLAPIHLINEQLGVYAHGGMAVDSRGRVIGMIDEDPSSQNNANRAIAPAAGISALLAEAGVGNSLSDSDRAYRSGLDAYFNGRYSTAISQLEAVARDVPTNQTAQAYRQKAVDRLAIEGDASEGSPGWLIPVVAAVVGALIVGVVVVVLFLLRRNRRRKLDPFAPMSGAPMSYGPTSGVPMSGAPMSGAPMSYGPTSGVPMSGAPMSGAPMSYGPTSGGPVAYGPTPGAPMPPQPGAYPGPHPPYQATPPGYQYQQQAQDQSSYDQTTQLLHQQQAPHQPTYDQSVAYDDPQTQVLRPASNQPPTSYDPPPTSNDPPSTSYDEPSYDQPTFDDTQPQPVPYEPVSASDESEDEQPRSEAPPVPEAPDSSPPPPPIRAPWDAPPQAPWPTAQWAPPPPGHNAAPANNADRQSPTP